MTIRAHSRGKRCKRVLAQLLGSQEEPPGARFSFGVKLMTNPPSDWVNEHIIGIDVCYYFKRVKFVAGTRSGCS